MAVFAISLALVPRGDAGEFIDAVSVTDSPKDVVEKLSKALIAKPTKRELDMCLRSDNAGAALSAYWYERIWVEPSFKRSKQVDMSQFFAFVEGRLCTRIPPIWREAVATREKDHCHFMMEHLGRAVSDPSIYAAIQSQEKIDEKWTLVTNGKRIALPDRVKLGRPLQSIAYAANGSGQLFVADYWARAVSFDLVCIDEKVSQVIWHSQVHPVPPGTTYSGTGFNLVDIVIELNRIMVFGISDNAMYLNVFDSRTGAVEFRFSSHCFDMAIRKVAASDK